jgi:dipeptidase
MGLASIGLDKRVTLRTRHERTCHPARHSYTTRALRDLKGRIDVSQMMRILRSHSLKNEPVQESWDPSKGGMASICIHSKPLTVPTQTTSSYVGHLLPELQVHWFTGTAAPCTSLFKPVWTETGLPDLGPAPGSHYDGKSLWWAHERLHRKILEDYSSKIRIIRQDQQDFESRYLKRVLQVQSEIKAGRLSGNRRETLRQVTKEAFEEAEKLESKWLSKIEEQSIQRKPGLFYRRFWDSINRRAMIS